MMTDTKRGEEITSRVDNTRTNEARNQVDDKITKQLINLFIWAFASLSTIDCYHSATGAPAKQLKNFPCCKDRWLTMEIK